MKTVEVKDRAEWRAWLAANHDKVTEVWLVYYKKETGKASVAYGASVEEALCYGWVDSIIQRMHANEDDLYIMGQAPEDELEVEAYPFAPNPLVIMAPSGHPLVGMKNIPLSRIYVFGDFTSLFLILLL